MCGTLEVKFKLIDRENEQNFVAFVYCGHKMYAMY